MPYGIALVRIAFNAEVVCRCCPHRGFRDTSLGLFPLVLCVRGTVDDILESDLDIHTNACSDDVTMELSQTNKRGC